MKAYCEVENGKIYFETHGKGEVLVLLRGLGRSLRYWMGFEKHLAKDFRVVMIDARGIGQTTATMQWHHGIDQLARDCMEVMNQLKVKRFHVFGLSLGGMIAMSLAAQYPQAIKSLVVANSSSADYLGMRMQVRAIKSLALGLIQGHFYENLMRLVVPPATARSRGSEILEAWEAIVETEGFPVPTILKQILASARFRIKGKIEDPKIPVLILYGSLDRLVSPRNSKQLHHLIPHSKIKVIKGAGHEVTLGHEQEVSTLIRAFTLKS